MHADAPVRSNDKNNKKKKDDDIRVTSYTRRALRRDRFIARRSSAVRPLSALLRAWFRVRFTRTKLQKVPLSADRRGERSPSALLKPFELARPPGDANFRGSRFLCEQCSPRDPPRNRRSTSNHFNLSFSLSLPRLAREITRRVI